MKTIFSPLSEDYLRDPWAVFRNLRDGSPCFWAPSANSWVVSRYLDCKFVLGENNLFARDPSRVGRDKNPVRSSIQTEDPPSQLVLRRRMMKALHAQDLRQIAVDSYDLLIHEISKRDRGEEFDLVNAAIAPAAMKMISQALGVEGFDVAHYTEMSHRLTRAMDSGVDPSRLSSGMKSGAELRTKVRDWFGSPSGVGMMRTLIDDEIVQSELERKGENYLGNTVGGIFNAGFSTTVAVTTSLLELELRHPGTMAAAASAPNLETAANELLRYLSPAQATSRLALHKMNLAGTVVQRGDTVITLMAAGNRDERQFDDPDDLHFDRAPNAHLAFAWGPHVCLGAQLALNWIVVVLEKSDFLLDQVRILDIKPLDSATLRTTQKMIARKI